jgi:chemosensory pili system protein ChpA (sensor histidine kinase/response regulator)
VDHELLLSVFLMEAWDAVATVEESLDAFAAGRDPALLHVVTHRVRGSAALHGFPRVAAIAAEMEGLVESALAGPDVDRAGAAARLAALTVPLKQALETIGTTGREDDPPPTSLTALEHFFADNGEVVQYFVPEAVEHLELMASALAGLERGEPREAELARLFRAAHTLKGAAYTVGCRPVGDLAHRIEDLLAVVRDERRATCAEIMDAVFAGMEALRLMLRVADGDRPDLGEAVARAERLLEAARAAPAPIVAAPPAAPEPPGADEASAAPGEGAVAPAPVSRPSLVPRPASSSGRPGPGGTIRVGLDRLDALMNMVGELVTARTRLEHRLTQLGHVGDLLRFTQSRMARVVAEFERKYVDPRLAAPAASVAPPAPSGESPDSALFAELEFDRYDDFSVLARSVGELGTDLAEIQGQLAGLIRSVRGDTAQIQQLSGGLRGELSRARMVPVGRLFARFPRQVREAARAAGRSVVLQVQGEAVELDTSLIEQLTDPLLHLLQNAVVHGIEPEAERRERGKPPQGTIAIRAEHRAGAVHVEVSDDGRGIDVEAVKARALACGALNAETLATLSRREVLDLIFLPGLSTVSAVTTAAGRGVGMDVVRTNVARLGGEIDVDTQAGVGTRFAIRLPLTVVVTEVMHVRAAGEVLAVPLTAVRAITRLRAGDLQAGEGALRVRVGEEQAELVHLAEVLGLPGGPAADVLTVLVLRGGRRSLAVVVEELLGKEEVVIKGLGRFLEGLAPYAGATVSAEGRVVLLLDPARLADVAGRGTAAPATAAARPAVPSRAPVAGRRILLVDDSVSVRRFVGQMLARAGLEVVTARDGAEGLARLAETAVDAVVTDLEMPRMNGYELIRHLRRRPATRHLPVVVLTTRAGDKHAGLARQLGISHYVTKPVETRDFVALVDALTQGPLGAERTA